MSNSQKNLEDDLVFDPTLDATDEELELAQLKEQLGVLITRGTPVPYVKNVRRRIKELDPTYEPDTSVAA